MNYAQFQQTINNLFGELIDQFKDQGEYGFNHQHTGQINTIGYTTNLTPEVVEQAHEKKVDLIVTHHDAWDFVFGMREACIKKLEQYDIGHYYIHLPLDYAAFGTANALLREIGEVTMIQQSHHLDDDSVIGVGELTVPMTFEQLAKRVSTVVAEDIKAWQFGEQRISKIGVLTGAGDRSIYMRQAKEMDCDVYITGECTLYTIQYAQFIGMNLFVGSHTFTELFGVRNLALNIQACHPSIQIVELAEQHIETGGHYEN